MLSQPEPVLAVTEKRAAELLSISIDSLRRARRAGRGPRFVRIGGGPNSTVRYRISDLDAWLQENSFSSRSEELSHG